MVYSAIKPYIFRKKTNKEEMISILKSAAAKEENSPHDMASHLFIDGNKESVSIFYK